MSLLPKIIIAIIFSIILTAVHLRVLYEEQNFREYLKHGLICSFMTVVFVVVVHFLYET